VKPLRDGSQSGALEPLASCIDPYSSSSSCFTAKVNICMRHVEQQLTSVTAFRKPADYVFYQHWYDIKSWAAQVDI